MFVILTLISLVRFLFLFLFLLYIHTLLFIYFSLFHLKILFSLHTFFLFISLNNFLWIRSLTKASVVSQRLLFNLFVLLLSLECLRWFESVGPTTGTKATQNNVHLSDFPLLFAFFFRPSQTWDSWTSLVTLKLKRRGFYSVVELVTSRRLLQTGWFKEVRGKEKVVKCCFALMGLNLSWNLWHL